ncbi:MAG: hypothetical protein HC895_01470 [Leptolyngbyaceae cyanobacterium SM1_3_5]|nr:hypothetical protein [Leptolyngbyaceae cyanobacterium SM1_3_5]
MNKAIEDIYPLSPLQQGMLFHGLLAPESGVFVVQVCFEIHGDLDLTKFEQAWQQAIDRHAILRSAFAWQEKPLQVVGKQAKLAIELLDWRSILPDQQQQQRDALLQEQRSKGFNPAKAPLMRITLIRVQENVYQAVWSYHHLLLDGWSVPILLQDVFAFYQQIRLPRVRSYRDYIVWLQQQDLSQAEAFWRRMLQGFAAPTPLGIDTVSGHHDRASTSAQPTYLEQQLQLALNLGGELQAFAQRHQLTLNSIVLGAYALLLGRYSGESDVVFGTTVSGRPASLVGSEAIVGLFINTLPMRVRLDNQPVLPWLHQLQAQQVELRDYEYTPLAEIQRWSEIPRSTPLFDSLLIFENYPIAPSLQQSIAALNLQNIRTIEQTNYPLTVYAVADGAITLRILYDCDRFTSEAIDRMLGHLQTLLTGMIRQLEQPISELPILTAAEQQQFDQWNATETNYADLPLPQLFEAQVDRSPDAIAVHIWQSIAHLP